MQQQSVNEYLDFAKQVAREAGEIMLKYFGKNPKSEFKSDDSIVTIADYEINDHVIRRVREAHPTHGIHGEESSHALGATELWVCDPIDGTALFAREIAMSVFSIAFVQDGVPQVGVVYDPYNDRMYAGAIGLGAFLNDKPLQVASEDFSSATAIGFDWWASCDYDLLPAVRELSLATGVYPLSPGSATHNMMLVASGKFVASVFPGTEAKCVDVAAAKVIVEEAGGKVTDLSGNDQRYDGDIVGAIVSNGVVHDTMVNYMNRYLRKSAETLKEAQ